MGKWVGTHCFVKNGEVKVGITRDWRGNGSLSSVKGKEVG